MQFGKKYNIGITVPADPIIVKLIKGEVAKKDIPGIVKVFLCVEWHRNGARRSREISQTDFDVSPLKINLGKTENGYLGVTYLTKKEIVDHRINCVSFTSLVDGYIQLDISVYNFDGQNMHPYRIFTGKVEKGKVYEINQVVTGKILLAVNLLKDITPEPELPGKYTIGYLEYQLNKVDSK